MGLSGWAYAAAFLMSVGLAWVLTPLALRLAERRKVLDHPGDYKMQESPIPYLGGLAITAAFAVTIFAASIVYRPVTGLKELAVILGLALLLGVMGLIDDIRGLSPWIRFGIEIAAAVAIFQVGIKVELFASPVANTVLTVIWIVGVTNAFNLLDNMDGLSAGTAAIAAGFFFLIAALNGQFLIAGLSIALAGCAVGFLRHNFHPAKIYMGDAGSLFIGFLLSIIGIKLRFDAPLQVTFMVPVLVLGVPIFDTVLVVTTRLMNRLNPLAGGRDHTSHRLVFVGIPIRAAVSLIYAAGIALGWLSIVMTRVDIATGMILMAFVLTVGLFVAFLLGMVPVHEGSKRRRMMIVKVAEHEEPSPPGHVDNGHPLSRVARDEHSQGSESSGGSTPS